MCVRGSATKVEDAACEMKSSEPVENKPIAQRLTDTHVLKQGLRLYIVMALSTTTISLCESCHAIIV